MPARLPFRGDPAQDRDRQDPALQAPGIAGLGARPGLSRAQQGARLSAPAAARAGALALVLGQAARLAFAVWSAVVVARASDPVGTTTIVANQLPEAVVVLACALFAAGGGRGGLLAGMLAAVVELSRQVPTWLAIDLARPGLSGESAIYLSAAVVQSAGAAAAILLFRRALDGWPVPPAPPAGRGRGLRLAWTAIGVQAAACIAVILLALAVRLLEILGSLPRAQEHGLAAFPGSTIGTLFVAAGLTLAPLLVASLIGLRRPTQLAIGLAFVAQAAWGVLLLAVAVDAVAEDRLPFLAVAVALLPPLAVAVLLLGVRPAPADNLSL